jgi:uncharacterized membrane protein YeaQ/YmgE (transglycosylase-associated protein family)
MNGHGCLPWIGLILPLSNVPVPFVVVSFTELYGLKTKVCRLHCRALQVIFKWSQLMMSILGTLFIGLIVGFIARAIKPGDDKLGWIMTAILGVAGSFLAGYAGKALGFYQQGQVAGFIASVVGAIVLLFVYALVKSKVK